MGARQLDFYDFNETRELEREINKKTAKDRAEKMRKKERRDLALLKLVIIGFLCIIFSVGLLVVRGLANINKTQQEIIALEKTKKDLLEEKTQIISEIEAIKASSQIQEEAKFKLGMQYPEEGQIVYLSIEDNNIKAKENKSILRFFTLMSKGL